MKIKMFTDSDVGGLQHLVNKWLADHPAIEVLQMFQSESTASNGQWRATITVFYRDQ